MVNKSIHVGYCIWVANYEFWICPIGSPIGFGSLIFLAISDLRVANYIRVGYSIVESTRNMAFNKESILGSIQCSLWILKISLVSFVILRLQIPWKIIVFWWKEIPIQYQSSFFKHFHGDFMRKVPMLRKDYVRKK